MSEDGFYPIMKNISSQLGRSMGARPYIALIDASGKLRYLDEGLNEYKDYMVKFTENNFTLLKVGDHSLPLSGTNLVFFKPSEIFILAIHTKKGAIGQLLSFKNMMYDFTQKIEPLIGEISPIYLEEKREKQKAEEKKKKLKPRHVVTTTNKLNRSKKFSLAETKILDLCDGNHSINDICNETSYSKLKVDSIIKKFKKKGWIEEKTIIG
ncbi:MAG: hypothetical protein EU549_01115 [Promethearchaeota archaeon]|nr:MAG: hypothetical protein EU549_01115 [Candidatus Lokiarchaeota archaeon]